MENEFANQFWKKYFNTNLEISWNLFSEAYQSEFKKLNLEKLRGLKKLFKNLEFINLFLYKDIVSKFGFPFPEDLLEKIEKYTSIIGNTENLNIKFDENVLNDYLQMILKYDSTFRDFNNLNIKIDKSIPVQISKNGNKYNALEFLLNTKFGHRFLILGNLRIYIFTKLGNASSGKITKFI